MKAARLVILAVVATGFAAGSLAGCNCGSGPKADNTTVDSGASETDSGISAESTADSGQIDAGELDAGETDSGVTEDAGTNEPEIVIDLDFETTLPATLDGGTALLTPSQGYEPLGPTGNTFGPTFLRAETGNAISLTISDLPHHTSLSIDFLFAAIDSLDGTGSFPAGDFFRVDLDGTTIFRESFANATPSQIQSYNPPVPEIVLARHVDLGFAGPGSFYTDSAYNLGLDPQFDDWPHTASSVTLTFMLEGEGVQSLVDESWAIDNLRVTAGHSPRARLDGGIE